MAFHAGALFALHLDLGWDARDAEIIVGTSAGSVIATSLRAQVAPEDLVAWASDATPTVAGTKFRKLMRASDEVPMARRLPRPTYPGRTAFGALAHPSQLGAALATVLPNGLADHGHRLTVMDPMLPKWPTKQLWISAVRVGDGRLSWFGPSRDLEMFGPGGRVAVSGAVPVAPSKAVAASCAVPFIARPVRIGKHRYVDGGVRSPTNADVLAGQDLDLIIVLSPMGETVDGNGRSPSRRLAQRRLDQELRVLRKLDVPVQVISPDTATAKAVGWNVFDQSSTPTVMRKALLGTSPQLDDSTISILRGGRKPHALARSLRRPASDQSAA